MSRVFRASVLFAVASLLLTAHSPAADAAPSTFHLIAPEALNSKQVAVVIGTTTVPLTAQKAGVPHFTGQAELPAGAATYKYSINGEVEKFDRKLPEGRTETYNDFFNRQATVTNLPPFPWPLQDEGVEVAQWNRAAPRAPLFDDSYIPTLYFSGAASPSDSGAPATLYVILKEEIVEIPDAKWFQYKADSWKYGSAFNFTQGADKFGGRTQFKFRSGEFDPTQLREKTYTDIMHSLGVPVAEQVHVRVYADGGKPVGLYILTDLMSPIPEGQRSFGFSAFQQGDPAKKERQGVTLDCGTGATFEYKSDNPRDNDACYGIDMYRSDPAMVALTKTLAAVDPNNAATQDALDAILDVDGVLRQMVMEYLTINWDGYWSQSSNFVMYYDEFETKKWYFSDQDFDQTFGSANNVADSPPASYKNFPAPGPTRPGGKRPLIENLLAVPKWRARFEKILTETVKHTFNPVAFNRRIDAFADVLRPEVNWDHSFKPDGDRHFAFADFDKGLTETTPYRVGPANLGVGWGLKTFVSARADGVAREFGFQWDATPRDPPAAGQAEQSSDAAPAPGSSATPKKDQASAAAPSFAAVGAASALVVAAAAASFAQLL